tara:strand:- start:441 stop:671 length:231 start_codon:yes stop_codon:yes gene_type:complete
MYIETWQLFFLAGVGIAAFFSYRSGFKDGCMSGINHCLTDLTKMGLISQYEDPETGEIEVGRYDAIQKQLGVKNEQ